MWPEGVGLARPVPKAEDRSPLTVPVLVAKLWAPAAGGRSPRARVDRGIVGSSRNRRVSTVSTSVLCNMLRTFNGKPRCLFVLKPNITAGSLLSEGGGEGARLGAQTAPSHCREGGPGGEAAPTSSPAGHSEDWFYPAGRVWSSLLFDFAVNTCLTGGAAETEEIRP